MAYTTLGGETRLPLHDAHVQLCRLSQYGVSAMDQLFTLYNGQGVRRLSPPAMAR